MERYRLFSLLQRRLERRASTRRCGIPRLFSNRCFSRRNKCIIYLSLRN